MIVSGVVSAKADGLPTPLPQPNDSIKVSLLSAAPGKIIYELEGHSLLRVRYSGYDITFSWGVFDFNTDDFIYRFVKGETDYKVGVYPTYVALDEYIRNGRRITEQEINLSPEQAQRLIGYLDANLHKENVYYRYNYLKDNCATRPIMLLEKAYGDSIRFTSPQKSGETYRTMMQSFHKNYPWYQFGIDLALGSELDQPISARESGFAPARLVNIMKDAKVGDTNVIKSEDILIPGDEIGTIDAPTPWYLTPVFVSCVVCIIGFIILIYGIKHKLSCRIFVTTLFGLFFIAGLFLTFLIFVSVHEATSPNWIYLWLNPLCIVAIIGAWLKKRNRVIVCYHFLNFVAILCLIGIGIFHVQHLNSAFYPLMLLDAAISARYILNK